MRDQVMCNQKDKVPSHNIDDRTKDIIVWLNKIEKSKLTIKEFFENGEIKIDYRTCQGLECELCIKACPTSALYWRDGKVGIVKDLCVYCGACVINCIVDDCITIERKRENGKVERFSTPRDVILLYRIRNAERRCVRTRSFLPNNEAYLKRTKKLAKK